LKTLREGLSPSPKSGPKFDPETLRQDEIQCGGVEKILRKGALVLLHLEIVLVFGKILCHGDELVPDVVLPIQHLIGSRARRTRSLVLRLAMTNGNDSDDGKQSDRH